MTVNLAEVHRLEVIQERAAASEASAGFNKVYAASRRGVASAEALAVADRVRDRTWRRVLEAVEAARLDGMVRSEILKALASGRGKTVPRIVRDMTKDYEFSQRLRRALQGDGYDLGAVTNEESVSA